MTQVVSLTASTCLCGALPSNFAQKSDYFFSAGGGDRVTTCRAQVWFGSGSIIRLVDFPGFQAGVNWKNLRQITQACDGRVSPSQAGGRRGAVWVLLGC